MTNAIAMFNMHFRIWFRHFKLDFCWCKKTILLSSRKQGKTGQHENKNGSSFLDKDCNHPVFFCPCLMDVQKVKARYEDIYCKCLDIIQTKLSLAQQREWIIHDDLVNERFLVLTTFHACSSDFNLAKLGSLGKKEESSGATHKDPFHNESRFKVQNAHPVE